MHKRYIYLLTTFVLVLVIGIPVFVLKNSSSELNWDFKGPVEKVTFGEDRVIDTLVVNGKVYRLADIKWANFNINIVKGDTAIKKKGNKYIKFIKARTKDTIYYNKEY